MVRHLLRYRGLATRRRLSGGGRLAGAIGSVALLGCLFALWVGMDGVAGADLAADTPEGRRRLVLDRAFWLNALAILVFAYTTFEVLFRGRDRRLVVTLPLDGGARWVELIVTAAVVHLPLLLPAAAYAVGLFTRGAEDEALFVALLTASSYVMGVPVSALLHLLAGQSLLSTGGALRRSLGGRLVPDDATWLIYSPAGGLTVTLVVAIIWERMLAHALLEGGAGSPWTPLAISVAIGCWCVWRGRSVAAEDLHAIMPRFSEVDVAPPYREDGLPQVTAGQGLARWIPAEARPYFLRDLRQLRRRHRLDRVLVWGYALVVLRLVWEASSVSDQVGRALAALWIFTAVVIVSTFRARGRELGSSWLSMTQPITPRRSRQGALVAALVYPVQAWLWTGLACLLAADLTAALWALGLGIVPVLGGTWLAEQLAGRVPSRHLPWAAMTWRALALTSLGAWLWMG